MASKSLSMSGLKLASAASATSSTSAAVMNVGARRSFFVMAAVTRSALPRKLFPSELLRPSLTSRSASTATAKAPLIGLHSEAETAFAEDIKVAEKLTSEEDELVDVLEEGLEESPGATSDPSLAFSNLSSSIHPNTLKAVTVAPFQHTHMSPVQAKILPMLPSLALSRDHVHHNVAGEKSLEYMKGVDPVPKDLLVKAKTGTGKTMAFLIPSIEARLAQLSSHTATTVAAAAQAGTTLSPADIALAEATYARENVGALIISPTRELATQIAVEAQNLTSHHKGWQVQVLLGGESKRMQLASWHGDGGTGRYINDRRGNGGARMPGIKSGGRKDIVVATPGRLLDLINSENGFKDSFKGCRLFVLDEADTLLDMGFREDIERIAGFLPPSPTRQTFLFSATVSKAIQSIAQSTLSRDHEFVNCVQKDDSPVHAHIPQYHTVVKSADELLPHVLRLIALDQLEHAAPTASQDGDIRKGNKSKIVIFLSTTNMVNLFSTILRNSLDVLPCATGSGKGTAYVPGTQIFEMHAKLDMKQRMKVSAGFRGEKDIPTPEELAKRMKRELSYGNSPKGARYPPRPSSPRLLALQKEHAALLVGGGAKILVTSDVSARGVDYPGVTRVIQVGAPASEDIYVHRVGRTGRGSNRQGRGDLVLMPFEMGFVRNRLGKFGLGAVTTGDVQKELEEKVAEGIQGAAGRTYSKANVAEIPILARQVQHALAAQDSDRVGQGYCSQIGFFIGKAREIGLEIREVLRGLRGMWVDMWGLEREPSISRNLREMVESAERGSGGGMMRDRRSSGGWGNKDRNPSYGSRNGSNLYGSRNGNNSYGSRDGSSSSYGSRNGSSSYGSRNSDSSLYSNRGSSYGGSNAADSWLSSGSGSGARSNAFTDSGYGYAKGTRAGLTNEKLFSRRKESSWEDGGRSSWNDKGDSGGYGERSGSSDRGGFSERRSSSSSRGANSWQTRGRMNKKSDWRSDID